MQVGSLVECIEGFYPDCYQGLMPIVGNVYTVQNITEWPSKKGRNLSLEEIPSKTGFNAYRFVEVLPPISISIESLIHQHA